MNISTLSKQFEHLNAGSSVPWNSLRQKHWQEFLDKGLPTKKLEHWRYTPLKRTFEADYQLAGPSKSERPEQNLDSHFYTFVFVDGRFQADLGNYKASNIIVESLRDAWKSGEYKVQEGTSPTLITNPFVHLNYAMIDDGLYLNIPASTLLDKPIKIEYITTQASNAMVHPHVVLNVEAGASLNFWEDFLSLGNKNWTNAVTQIHLHEHAKIQHIKSCDTKSESWHLDHTIVENAESAEYDSVALYHGSGVERNQIEVQLNGKDARCDLYGLYAPQSSGHSDHYTIVNHREPQTFSSQLYKGLLEDESMAVFSGTVKVAKHAIGVDSLQLNKNILLGKKARIESQPQLEINADDVKCAHGTTIGQLAEDELFYLQARGIPKCQAYQMLALGFANEITLKISNPQIREIINGRVKINPQEQVEQAHV